MDDLSTSYQPAGKGDGKITGSSSSSKSDVGPGRSTASNILPTNKHVVLHELNQMMNATDFQMQQETHDAAAKAADWLRRLTDDDTLFERNEHIDKLLLAKEVISIKHAESALDEIKVRTSLKIQTDMLIKPVFLGYLPPDLRWPEFDSYQRGIHPPLVDPVSQLSR